MQTSYKLHSCLQDFRRHSYQYNSITNYVTAYSLHTAEQICVVLKVQVCNRMFPVTLRIRLWATSEYILVFSLSRLHSGEHVLHTSPPLLKPTGQNRSHSCDSGYFLPHCPSLLATQLGDITGCESYLNRDVKCNVARYENTGAQPRLRYQANGNVYHSTFPISFFSSEEGDDMKRKETE
jgi:hypothetical protein